MERLTYVKEKKRQSRGRHPTKYSSRHTMQELVSRLAAHEDTDLEPGEVVQRLATLRRSGR